MDTKRREIYLFIYLFYYFITFFNTEKTFRARDDVDCFLRATQAISPKRKLRFEPI